MLSKLFSIYMSYSFTIKPVLTSDKSWCMRTLPIGQNPEKYRHNMFKMAIYHYYAPMCMAN